MSQQLILFTITLLISLSYASTIYTISDLTYTDELFECQANFWTASNMRPANIYTTCNGNYVLGGYNVLGSYLLGLGGITLLSPTAQGDYYQRIYSSIPSHNLIQFSFNLWAIDAWSTSGTFRLQFDTTTINGFGLTQSTFPSNLCGASGKDFQPVVVMGTVIHSATTLTLKVLHYLNQDSATASIAFRDLNLQFITADTSGLATSICAKATVAIPSGFECPCPTGQYKLAGVCTACDSSCASCYGGTSKQCYSCATGSLFNGVECILCDVACSFCYGTAYNQCSECSDSYWMVGNHTCIPYCPSTLVVDSTNRNCTSPCSSTEKILWDGSCTTTCASPLSQGTIYSTFASCDFPCTDISNYLYWNGTCASTCDSPLTSVVYKSRRFCQYSCTTAGDYLYWNGSCIGSCNTAVYSTRTEGGKQFCDFPCAANQHLYWNGSCISGSCSSPLVERVESTKMFCDYPCAATGYYLYWNGSCLSSCDTTVLSIRTEGGRQFCDFPCAANQHLYWNGSCISGSCSSPLVERVENTKMFCDYPCAATGYYLYWNGSCLSSCDTTIYSTRTEGGRAFCDFPCCSTQYLYWNGTCGNECESPLTVRTEASRNYCDNSCAATGKFLYWNGSCFSSCDSPLVQETINTVLYCNYPCTDNQYLLDNGTCSNSCEYPLIPKTVASQLYCDYSCVSTDFLLWNGTCASACDPPLVQRIEGTVQYCDSPCDSDMFLYPNGSCYDSCDSPYSKVTTGNITYCEVPCLSTEFRLSNGTCATSCYAPYRNVTMDYGTACATPCDSEYEFYYPATGTCSSTCAYKVAVVDGLYLTCTTKGSTTTSTGGASVTVVTDEVKMIRMLQYLCYLDIDYPTSLSVISISHGRTFLAPAINFDMPDSIRDKIDVQWIPTVFSRRGLHSSFLVNFWPEFMLCAVGAIVVSTIMLCQMIANKKNNGKAIAVLAKLKTIIQWNLFIVAFATNLDNIILYFAIDIASSDFDSPFAFSSLFISFILVGLMAAFFIYTYIMVKRAEKNKIAPEISKLQSQVSFISRYPESQVLYRGFRDKISRISQHFYLIYSIRAAFPTLMSYALYKYPLPQMVIQVVVSFLVLLFVVWKKPIKSKINNTQLIILETMLCNVNLCGLILVVLSKSGQSESDAAKVFGDAIVLHNTWINILVLVFLVMKITMQVQEIYTLFKEKKVQDRSIWCQLLVNFLQQGGFGFEKLSLDPQQGRKMKTMPRILIPKMIPVIDSKPDVSLLGRPSEILSPSTTKIEEQPDEEEETPPEIWLPVSRPFIPTNDKNCASYWLRPGEREKSLIDPLGLNSPKDLDGSTLSHIPNSRRSNYSRSSIEKHHDMTSESPRLWLAQQSSPMLRIKRRKERLKTSQFLPTFNPLPSENTPRSDMPGDSEYDDLPTDRTLKGILRSKFEIEETNKKIFSKKRGLTIKTNNGINESGMSGGPVDQTIDRVIYEDKLDQILESAAQNGVMDVAVEDIEN